MDNAAKEVYEQVTQAEDAEGHVTFYAFLDKLTKLGELFKHKKEGSFFINEIKMQEKRNVLNSNDYINNVHTNFKGQFCDGCPNDREKKKNFANCLSNSPKNVTCTDQEISTIASYLGIKGNKKKKMKMENLTELNKIKNHKIHFKCAATKNEMHVINAHTKLIGQGSAVRPICGKIKILKRKKKINERGDWDESESESESDNENDNESESENKHVHAEKNADMNYFPECKHIMQNTLYSRNNVLPDIMTSISSPCVSEERDLIRATYDKKKIKGKNENIYRKNVKDRQMFDKGNMKNKHSVGEDNACRININMSEKKKKKNSDHIHNIPRAHSDLMYYSSASEKNVTSGSHEEFTEEKINKRCIIKDIDEGVINDYRDKNRDKYKYKYKFNVKDRDTDKDKTNKKDLLSNIEVKGEFTNKRKVTINNALVLIKPSKKNSSSTLMNNEPFRNFTKDLLHTTQEGLRNRITRNSKQKINYVYLNEKKIIDNISEKEIRLNKSKKYFLTRLLEGQLLKKIIKYNYKGNIIRKRSTHKSMTNKNNLNNSRKEEKNKKKKRKKFKYEINSNIIQNRKDPYCRLSLLLSSANKNAVSEGKIRSSMYKDVYTNYHIFPEKKKCTLDHIHHSIHLDNQMKNYINEQIKYFGKNMRKENIEKIYCHIMKNLENESPSPTHAGDRIWCKGARKNDDCARYKPHPVASIQHDADEEMMHVKIPASEIKQYIKKMYMNDQINNKDKTKIWDVVNFDTIKGGDYTFRADETTNDATREANETAEKEKEENLYYRLIKKNKLINQLEILKQGEKKKKIKNNNNNGNNNGNNSNNNDNDNNGNNNGNNNNYSSNNCSANNMTNFSQIYEYLIQHKNILKKKLAIEKKKNKKEFFKELQAIETKMKIFVNNFQEIIKQKERKDEETNISFDKSTKYEMGRNSHVHTLLAILDEVIILLNNNFMHNKQKKFRH
ncbi:conserved Plasmodium protein, unknown function [Plasmodium malariae]|uniref:Uncharacterized protein n=2 Tax=Plasmodium malariae TaxID=5858 RepID=A0A1D3TDA2_PLAMA|nr:conserved Plasmodium protein, unknown function [Plasmodium malariae]SCP02801.1 conserved Plasmodium protein, unknown function [Plasmodium malariae]